MNTNLIKCDKCGGTGYELSPYKIRGSIWGVCSNPKCKGNVFLIESTPEYEEWHQESTIKEEQAISERKISKSTPTVTCPYCQSTDTKKISGTSRWLSTGLFGLASSKVGKQWHCRKCGSDF